MIHAYTGDGKGKTSTAIGLGMLARARGHNEKVAFLQFIKNNPSGELPVLENAGVEIYQFGNGFVYNRDDVGKMQEGLEKAVELIGQNYSMVVLDEVLTAFGLGLIKEEEILSLVEKANGTELVLTGRCNLSKAIKDSLDYHVELTNLRHPYEKGIKARRGVEY